jgi:large subunit ribosomal protein L9
MAVKATPGAMRAAENLRKQAAVRRAERDREFSALAEQIRVMELYFPVRAGETGKLYGSVTPGDIADQIKTSYGIELDRRRVGDHPLRELGEFMVPVRLEAGLAPTLRVVIFREGHDPRDEAGQAEEAVEAVAEPVMVEEMVEEADVVDAAPADMDMAEEAPSA